MNRYLGYREAPALAGLSDERVANGDFGEASGVAGMTRMLVRLINGERPTPLILPTELVIRDSA